LFLPFDLFELLLRLKLPEVLYLLPLPLP